MADKTLIEWTDATWNPITGCSVVSAGCKHCYAMKLAGTRLQHHPSRAALTIDTTAGPVWNGEVRFNSEWLNQPLRWRRPRRIFVCAHGDLFHENVSDEWIDYVFAVMALAPHHTFQVLTKRAARMRDYLSSSARRDEWARAGDMLAAGIEPQDYADISHIGEPGNLRSVYSSWPLPNVWMGVSVEDQDTADERIPQLLQTPAAVRWVSAEPLLEDVTIFSLDGPVDVPDGDQSPIDWLVVGGESGPKARPMHPAWARSLRDQCEAVGVAFLFKQWGEFATAYQSGRDENYLYDHASTGGWVDRDGAHSLGESAAPRDAMTAEHVFRIGKKAAGRLLDGVEHNGYPEAP